MNNSNFQNFYVGLLKIFEIFMNDATAITSFYRRQAEKTMGYFRIKLQKLTFCGNTINEQKILKSTYSKSGIFIYPFPKKIISLLLIFTFVFFENCYSYEIMLHSKYDTIKMRRVTVPPKIWASFDTTGEEDLRAYCGNRPLLLVKFRNNTPIEVWCEEN